MRAWFPPKTDGSQGVNLDLNGVTFELYSAYEMLADYGKGTLYFCICVVACRDNERYMSYISMRFRGQDSPPSGGQMRQPCFVDAKENDSMDLALTVFRVQG